ncbi:hypothetical protein AK830_g11559 [Neonectria ditissima]|uniref:Uncharacterized protein n=1 Tax=Neonectria ditissima TaxID=78410 RepID=A0A0P7AM23_9HYPO|nr:hypothetical protein AK830_g11559 [Neonectria ditissima]
MGISKTKLSRPCRYGEVTDIGGLASLQSIEHGFVRKLSTGEAFDKTVLYAHSDGWTNVSQDSAHYQTHEELAILHAHREEITKDFSDVHWSKQNGY